MGTNEQLMVIKNKAKKENRKGNQKWNKYLDDYGNYIKEYKLHYKKSNAGNKISLSLYPYMQQKREALKQRINKAHKNNCLNDDQIKRLINMNTIS
ncbi:hypothetical protein SAMN05444372_10160 [Flavobacterium micromati]|uniref:Uncharacterized protein n=1 Tax=Flavobacterium micromati TaxID=229205 RepID=A0A1M5FC03_9FLAO|nr:hypothetical protein [Flavobacterium micromati]MCL6461987.1 hypothetical protein [Flavobacterium micromati]SHF89074.1 hypothetical protein SAMN05444372_10160 [Flavobacterium micromati]